MRVLAIKKCKGNGIVTSLLEEFARGNIKPDERPFRRDSMYGRVLRQLCERQEAVLMMLDCRQTERFNHYLAANAEAAHLAEIDQFVYGYRLGAMMMVDVFCGQGVLLDDLE